MRRLGDTGPTEEVDELMAFEYKEISQGGNVVIMYKFGSNWETRYGNKWFYSDYYMLGAVIKVCAIEGIFEFSLIPRYCVFGGGWGEL